MRKNKFFLFLAFVFCFVALLSVPFRARALEGTAYSKDGVPIAYTVYGAGETVLVFVHGWSCNQSVWNAQIPYFEKKYRVITLDLAGHGSSGRGRNVYSLKAFGEDVASVVRANGARKVILIGHSMAGAVIIEAAEILPDTVIALIGIDTLQDLEETYTSEQIEGYIQSFRKDFKKTTDVFVRSMFPREADPALVNEVAGMMSGASPAVGTSAMEELMKRSYIEKPPKINVPVWCLNSELWPTRLEINHKYVSGFNVRTMPGVGHFLMMEAPDEFNKQLDSIIAEIVKEK